MTVYTIQASFSRGELSPKLHGRVDIDHYRLSLSTALNWTVLRQGGLRRRPGTVYAGEVKDSSDEGAVLLPFAFSNEQAYAIEFGDEYCRFFALDGQVYSGGSPYEIVSPYAIEDVAELHKAQSADVLYLAHASYEPQTLTRSGETSWAFADFEFKDGPYLDVNTTGTTLTPASYGSVTPVMTGNTAPWGTAASSTASSGSAYQVFDKTNATGMLLSGLPATISFTFNNGAPSSTATVDAYWIKIPAGISGFTTRVPTEWKFQGYDGSNWVTLDSRTGETGWITGERRYYEFINETAYQAYRLYITANDEGGALIYVDEVGMHQRATEQTAFNLTASGVTGVNDGDGFQSSDVGRIIRLLGSDNKWRWAKIIARTSTTVVTVQIYGHALVDLDPVVNWRLGSWGDVPGWPETVGFFQERLGWGGTTEQPRMVALSKSAEYEDYGTSQPLEASDGISLNMTGGRVNAIRFIEEGPDLLIGTSGSFRTIGAATSSEAFSATNVQQKQSTTTGASHIQPVTIGSVTIFANYYKTALHEAAYSYEANGYQTPELSILSDHLFADGISGMAYQAVPDSIIWVYRATGKVTAVTYERSQQVVGLTDIAVAGTDAAVESACTIPVESGDRLWMIVKRTINGATKRYVEYLADPHEEGDDIEDAVYFDSAVTVTNGSPSSTITGAGHLEGETVGVLADGVDIGDATVSSGGFTLPDGVSATKVTYGLRYQSYGKTLRLPQAGNRDGSALGRKKNVMSVHFDLYETGHMKVGTQTKQYNILRNDVSEVAGTAITPFTGMTQDAATDKWTDDGVVVFHTDKGYPAVVRAAMIGIEGEP